MRNPIENVTRLQKRLNDLQLENQILKNLLEQAGVSYKEPLSHLKADKVTEAYDFMTGIIDIAMIDQEIVW